MHVTCPNCSAGLKAPDDVVGKTVKCPKCPQPFKVSAPEPQVLVAEDAPSPAPSPTGADVGQRRQARKKSGGKWKLIAGVVGAVLLLAIIGSLLSGGGGGTSHLTFDKFKTKVEAAAFADNSGGGMYAHPDLFLKRMGKPSKKQKIGRRLYLYYPVKEGQAQVVVDAGHWYMEVAPENAGVVLEGINLL